MRSRHRIRNPVPGCPATRLASFELCSGDCDEDRIWIIDGVETAALETLRIAGIEQVIVTWRPVQRHSWNELISLTLVNKMMRPAIEE